MNSFITTCTAVEPLGKPYARNCLKIPAGPFAARMALLYASAPGTVRLVYADPPYVSFSTPVDIAADVVEGSFDVCQHPDGHIYVSYVSSVSNDLLVRKLTFAGGSWTVGAPVTVYEADDCYASYIMRLTNDRLCLCYDREAGGQHYISYKLSIDDGATWGSTSNPGDTFNGGADTVDGLMVQSGEFLYAIYRTGSAHLCYRFKMIDALVWSAEVELNGSGGYTDDLSAAVSSDGRIGLVYVSTNGLRFREHSGSSWSGEFSITDEDATLPTVAYFDGLPHITYRLGSDPAQMMHTAWETSGFGEPAVFDSRKAGLDSLLIYDHTSGTFEDKTAEANSEDGGDILHTATGVMLSGIGDALFFGVDQPFYSLRCELTVTGAGGEVIWKYWDGQVWQAFVPQSGAWHCASTPHDLLLWEDYSSLPAGWQKKTISGQNRYWLVAEVVTPFTTAPIGTRITTLTNLHHFSLQV